MQLLYYCCIHAHNSGREIDLDHLHDWWAVITFAAWPTCLTPTYSFFRPHLFFLGSLCISIYGGHPWKNGPKMSVYILEKLSTTGHSIYTTAELRRYRCLLMYRVAVCVNTPPQKKKLVYIHREMIERKRLVDVVRCPNGQRLAMTSNCNLRLPCR